jgi:DNA mismatch repair protein MutL
VLIFFKTNEKPVQEETEIVTIQGFVSKPEVCQKSRGEQFFFVNDRFIKVVASCRNGLRRNFTDGAQPSYLYLTVPPNTIDINIHPTKTEIKFDDEHAYTYDFTFFNKAQFGSV